MNHPTAASTAARTARRAATPRTVQYRGRRARAPRNRVETVAAIVRAASALLARSGPDGFGLAELGVKAGVSFGLIHRYFGGKDGLLREAMRQPFTRQLARVVDLYERGELRSGVEPVLALLFDAGRRNPDYVRLLAWGVLTDLLTDDVFAESRHTIERLLTLQRRAARLPRDVDARAVAALLVAATLGFQLFRPLVQALFQVDDRFDAVYRRHVARALAAFRATPGVRRTR